MIGEHNNNDVIPLTYNTITAARQIGDHVTVLLAGSDCSKVRCMQLHGDSCDDLTTIS